LFMLVFSCLYSVAVHAAVLPKLVWDITVWSVFVQVMLHAVGGLN